jgi:hypothetical protein
MEHHESAREIPKIEEPHWLSLCVAHFRKHLGFPSRQHRFNDGTSARTSSTWSLLHRHPPSAQGFGEHLHVPINIADNTNSFILCHMYNTYKHPMSATVAGSLLAYRAFFEPLYLMPSQLSSHTRRVLAPNLARRFQHTTRRARSVFQYVTTSTDTCQHLG